MVSAQGIQSAKQTYMQNSKTTCGIPAKLLRHDANAGRVRRLFMKPGRNRVQVRRIKRPIEQAQSCRLAPVFRIIGGHNFMRHDEMCDRFVFQGHSHMLSVSVTNGSSHTARRSDQTLGLFRHGTIQATQYSVAQVAVPGPGPGGHGTSKMTVAYF
ncbi:hypothetical protein GE21DRAFT_2595 [Neurospora crassa]|uniref:Uncharacterized protein n=1 Tax=Neurospora crassa (strain ATCC 24698 / 74-OR23-1A / CBS 708.71 / DSM 1257 / FGSC 987) TaxID=367110 RepID=Q7SFK5_NEUCR|nr:hypothetical protein NCU08613 [Neurospora crassa OR74A]EAA35585.1 hypothetical protein NCU08613 [Neurospora crassa OR74A]KHE81246.1 hypothetical protein GE21DRAFT_2595 [Neurospora crassa]|eukprot:XP_964821.1 hypothetical protein NCU08613 [Neurospora crassa OR74A]